MKNKKWLITRRDFMSGTVGAALGASLSGSEWAFGTENKARSSLVTVVRNEKVMDAEGSTVDANILRKMLDQAVMLTTGENTPMARKLGWWLGPSIGPASLAHNASTRQSCWRG